RIIPFPGHGGASPDEAWHAGLEAALSGDGEGPAADAWRELREDVRALAAPMAPDFERQLRERIAERGARRRAPKGWLHLPARPAAAAIIAGMGAVVVAVVIAGPWWGGASQEAVRGRAAEPAVSSSPRAGTPKGSSSTAQSAAAGSIAPESGGAASAPGRVQQLAATVSLAAAPTEVQAIADRVARLAVSDGGFVQSSHVQVQQGRTSEANLT